MTPHPPAFIKPLPARVYANKFGQNGPLKTRTGRPMKLTVDFRYEDRRLGWAVVWEDSKGVSTRDFLVRLAVAEAMGLKVVLT